MTLPVPNAITLPISVSITINSSTEQVLLGMNFIYKDNPVVHNVLPKGLIIA
jgi:hypothetical protein